MAIKRIRSPKHHYNLILRRWMNNYEDGKAPIMYDFEDIVTFAKITEKGDPMIIRRPFAKSIRIN